MFNNISAKSRRGQVDVHFILDQHSSMMFIVLARWNSILWL